jgi:hypothetical protein
MGWNSLTCTASLKIALSSALMCFNMVLFWVLTRPRRNRVPMRGSYSCKVVCPKWAFRCWRQICSPANFEGFIRGRPSNRTLYSRAGNASPKTSQGHVLAHVVRLPRVNREHELVAEKFDRFGFGRIILVVVVAEPVRLQYRHGLTVATDGYTRTITNVKGTGCLVKPSRQGRVQ